ncbi:MAG: DHHA1 domain-containing protein, partial [Hungatella sp.]
SKKALTGQVRIIEIPGGDLCACCGTHVARTGEIGIIKIIGMIHYKTGIRMSLLCGKQALLDYGKKQKQADAISRMLSAKPGLLAEAVERLKQENLAKEMQINQLYRQLFLTQSQQLDDDLGYLILFEEAWTPTALREFCTMLYEQNKGKVVLVCSGKGETYQYALGSRDEDMRVCSKMLNRLLDGRGGGSAQMAQGTFHASAEQITHIYREQEEAQWI